MTEDAAPRGRRVRMGVLVAACAGLAGLAVVAADDGISYFRTPSELAGSTAPGDSVRLGGLVLDGSLVEAPDGSTLVLTDGATDVAVSYPGRFPDVVREGEGAVVDGRMGTDGIVAAERIVLRHSNEYRAPVEGSS